MMDGIKSVTAVVLIWAFALVVLGLVSHIAFGIFMVGWNLL